MHLIRKNEDTASLRRIPFVLLDSGDNPILGQTFSPGDGSIKICKSGAAETNHAGTVTELAGGMYYYECSAGEVDTSGFLTVRIEKGSARVFRAWVQVVDFDPYDGAGLGLTGVNINLEQNIPVVDLTNKTTQTVGDALSAARADGAGKWKIVGNSLTIYGPNNAPVMQFVLNDPVNPSERAPNVV